MVQMVYVLLRPPKETVYIFQRITAQAVYLLLRCHEVGDPRRLYFGVRQHLSRIVVRAKKGPACTGGPSKYRVPDTGYVELNQFDYRFLGSVAAAGAELGDAGVPTVTTLIAGRDVLEELGDR